MRKIVFLYQQYGELGEFFSLYMPKLILIKNGFDVESINVKDIKKIKNSVVFIVKHINNNFINILKNNNNKIVIDIVDILCHVNSPKKYLEHLINIQNIDRVLVRQNWIIQLIGDKAFYIPHHYDYRVNQIKPNDINVQTNKISFPYTDPGGINLHMEHPSIFDVISIDGITHQNWDLIKEIHYQCMKNSFYFSIRNQNSKEFYFKPATKTAVAAAVGRCIITNNDKALEDLLPIDYPYFYNSLNSNFLEFYDSKIKNINSVEYQYGLECMKSVKEKTNIFNQLALYINLFNI